MRKKPLIFEDSYDKSGFVAQRTLAPHLHYHTELIIAREGSFDAIVDGECVHVAEGCGVIVFPYQIHEYIAVDSKRTAIMLVSPSAMPQFRKYIPGKLPKSCLIPKELIDDEILYAADRCEYYFEHKKCCSQMMVEAYRHLLMSLVLARIELRPAQDDDVDSLGKIMDHINSHYAEPITVASTAASLGISQSLISHLIAGKLHTGFREYVNMLRVQSAIEKLTLTNAPIGEIALDCGFGNFASFNRVFKAMIGQTPRQVRAETGTVVKTHGQHIGKIPK